MITEINEKKAFFAYSQLDYHSLVSMNLVTPNDSILIKYLKARAQVTLGGDVLYSELPSLHKTLIEALEAAYRYENLEHHLKILQRMPISNQNISNLMDTFVRAESEFIQGFLHSQSENYSQSIFHFLAASQIYSKLELWGPYGLCHFNIAVASSRLRKRGLYAKSLKQLRLLYKNNSDFAAEFRLVLLRANRSLDQERFVFANKLFTKCIQIATQQNRHHQIEFLKVHQFYASLKAHEANINDSNESEAHQWLWRLSFEADPASFFLINLPPLFKNNVLFFSYAADILLDRFIQEQNYELVLKYIPEFKKIFREKQLGLEAIDLRYYEIYAQIKIGDLSRVERIIQAYESDAMELRCVSRLKKSSQLRKMLFSIQNNSLKKTKLELIELKLDEKRYEIILGNKKYFLTDQPLLFHVIKLLAYNPEGLCNEKIMKYLYNVDFHPLRHDSRIKNLIYRIRKKIGYSNIIKIDQKYRLQPSIRFVIPAASTLSRFDKKAFILSSIQESTRLLSAKEIQLKSGIPIRTTQSYLCQFVVSGLIKKTGLGPDTRYFIEKKEAL